MPRLLLLVLAAAALVLAFHALSPVRWDAKSLRGEWIETQPPLPASGSLIYLTRENDNESAHTAGYALDLVAFPDRRAIWVVPREGYTAAQWKPDLVLERDGAFRSPWRDAVVAAPDLDARTVILANERSVVDEVRGRWRDAAALPLHVIETAKAPLVARPRLDATAGQGARLVAFLAVVAFWGELLRRSALRPYRAFAMTLALPLALGAHVALVHLIGYARLAPQMIAIAFQLAVLAWLLSRTTAPDVGGQEPRNDRAVVALIAAAFAIAFVRLDFDGDLLSHWLPMARAHFLFGYHDVGFLGDRYGVAQEATYPPGFPIVISTLMWIAGCDPRASLGPGADTQLVVILYRLVLASLVTSMLVALGTLIHAAKPRARVAQLAVPALAASAVPCLLGQPAAGEVALVPFVGFAALSFAAAEVSGQRGFAAAGVFLAGFLLLLKNDAAMIVPLLIAPWAWIARRQLRLGAAAASIAALLPWATWKVDVKLHNLDSTFAFDPFSLSRLFENAGLWFRLTGAAFKLLLSSPVFPTLLLLLPAVFFWSIARRRYSEVAAALGAMAYVAAVPAVYVFSRIEPFDYLQTSYGRLTLSASVCVWVLTLHTGLKEATS